MPSLTVKNIPDDLYDRIRRRAAANRRSINSEVIVCLERAVGLRRFDLEATLADARRIRERSAAYRIDDAAFDEAKRRGRS